MAIGAQVMGGIVATIVLYVIAPGKPGVELPHIATYPVTRSVCLAAGAFAKVVLTHVSDCHSAVANNAGKGICLSAAAPDGLVDSVLS